MIDSKSSNPHPNYSQPCEWCDALITLWLKDRKIIKEKTSRVLLTEQEIMESTDPQIVKRAKLAFLKENGSCSVFLGKMFNERLLQCKSMAVPTETEPCPGRHFI